MINLGTLFGKSSPPMAGLDIGTSGLRLVELADAGKGVLRLERYAFEALPRGAVVDGNIENFDQVAEAVATATQMGSLRLAVNCAGVATPGKILGRKGVLPLETYKTVIDINLIGTFNVLRLAAAEMARNGRAEDNGVIVNTASIAAFDGQAGQAAYAASKAAIAGMTLPIARDLARSAIRVCAIAPGIFGTPMLRGLPQDVQDGLAAEVPNPKRLGDPEEFARLAAFIVENPYMNGETIRIDGALRMR